MSWKTTSTRNLITNAPPSAITSQNLQRRISSCPNLQSLGLDFTEALHDTPEDSLGTTMNSPHNNNYRSSPPSSTTAGTASSSSTNMRIDPTNNNPLQAIREQMMRREHKYSHSYIKQEPLLPPPPLLGDDTSRTNDDCRQASTSHTGSTDSNPIMRQPQDTLRSLLFASAASRAEPYGPSSPRTPTVHAANDHSNAHSRPGGRRQRRQLPPTPRTPGRRHATLAADARWNRTPPLFFPRTLPLEEASREVTKKIRTEAGPMPAATSEASSVTRMRPQFQSAHVLQTLASALSVPFPTNPTSASNEVQPPGPPPLHVAPSRMPGLGTDGKAGRPQPPKKATSDIADFPSIDFASLGISSTPETKLTVSSASRIVRSDPEQRRPRRRMSAPSA